jgi:nucleoside-diphosphate-sugar epimerase
MNVLLTGGSGFLGKYLFDKTVDNGHKCYRLGRNGFSEIKADLISEFELPDINFDLVIHSAGKAHIEPKGKHEIQDFYRINVLGTMNLLEKLEKSPPQKFVFISSVSVYGLDIGSNIGEDAPLLAKDPYGNSKIQAEAMISSWCKRNNIKCTILRLPLIYGENPPGNLGKMISGIQRGFYFNIGDIEVRKSIVLAQDVANSIPSVSEIGGIYNLTDGHHPSVHQLSFRLAKFYNLKPIKSLPMVFVKFLAILGDLFGDKFIFNSKKFNKITSELTFSDTKAREKFDWDPTSVLDFIDQAKKFYN